MIGLFTSYSEPGIYTQTLSDDTIVTLQGGLRIPVLIGVGSENLGIVDYELVRGSSSTVDNLKTNEDVSSQFTGTNREFTVSLFPVVTGEGNGSSTFDPRQVSVTINGQPAGVAQVTGSTGKILLSSIPRTTDVVLVTYYFKRTDTRIGGSVDFPDFDNISNQADGVNLEFKVTYIPIVDGSNGGLATTDPTKVQVLITRGNETFEAEVLDVNGQAGTITLAEAPLSTDAVVASYWTNRWQDTFDYLPIDNITEVVRVGTGTGRSDFTNTLDFVVEENRIHWGHAFDISSGFTSQVTGSVPFKNQINATLFDNSVYMRPASGTADGSNRTFFLEFVPTEGTGKGTPTDNINLVGVYVGTDVSDALSNGEVELSTLQGATRKLVLKDAPSSGQRVFASYWYNILTDDVFTLTSMGNGEYEITSESNAGENILSIVADNPSHFVADPDFGLEGITFPVEGFDGVLVPGFAKEETILLNFFNATDYLVLSSIGAEGSNGSGTLNQTYIDNKTGTRFTIMEGDTVTYTSGDILEFDITPTFEVGNMQHLSIPGMRVQVTALTGVTSGNTSLFSTFNKSGAEPLVGDFYYITANYAKTEFPIKIYTKIKDVVSNFGDVNTENRLSLGASLAFSNGAVALALAQVLRDSSGVDASSSAYSETLKILEGAVQNTNIRPNVVCALTTKQEVINEVRLHCERMSTVRNKTERTAVFGFAVGTTPEQAQQFARVQRSERLLGIYPDGAVIGLLDQFGNVNEAAVDGSFLAAAFSGLAVNPIYDVATPLTHKTLTGFRRLIRTLDTVTMNQTAVSGITILEDLVPNLLIRHAMTTNPSTVLTREPTVVYIKDYVQQQTRAVLRPFIGIKFLPSVIQDVEAALNNLLNQLVNLQIITAFKGTSAIQDDIDPSILRVESFYSPVLPLNWILTTFNIRTKL